MMRRKMYLHWQASTSNSRGLFKLPHEGAGGIHKPSPNSEIFYRGSPPEVFLRKGILKICSKSHFGMGVLL